MWADNTPAYPPVAIPGTPRKVFDFCYASFLLCFDGFPQVVKFKDMTYTLQLEETDVIGKLFSFLLKSRSRNSVICFFTLTLVSSSEETINSFFYNKYFFYYIPGVLI